jgi:hypothetical protein
MARNIARHATEDTEKIATEAQRTQRELLRPQSHRGHRSCTGCHAGNATLQRIFSVLSVALWRNSRSPCVLCDSVADVLCALCGGYCG